MQGRKMKDKVLGPENVGMENMGPETAGLENEGPYCTRWKKKDQEEASIYQSHRMNIAANFNELKTIIHAKTTQCNKV